jgi:cytochrome c-type biogenesis protein CcmH/NrfG
VPVATAAWILSQGKRLPESIEEYRRAQRMAPDNPRVLAELALVYHASGLDEEAKRHADQALARNPNLVSARILLAERALEDRRISEALKQSERAVAVAPNAAAARLVLADALLSAGRTAAAASTFDHMLELVDEHGAAGLPEARLKVVREARAEGRLPPPRFAPRPKSTARTTWGSKHRPTQHHALPPPPPPPAREQRTHGSPPQAAPRINSPPPEVAR